MDSDSDAEDLDKELDRHGSELLGNLGQKDQEDEFFAKMSLNN